MVGFQAYIKGARAGDAAEEILNVMRDSDRVAVIEGKMFAALKAEGKPVNVANMYTFYVDLYEKHGTRSEDRVAAVNAMAKLKFALEIEEAQKDPKIARVDVPNNLGFYDGSGAGPVKGTYLYKAIEAARAARRANLTPIERALEEHVPDSGQRDRVRAILAKVDDGSRNEDQIIVRLGNKSAAGQGQLFSSQDVDYAKALDVYEQYHAEQVRGRRQQATTPVAPAAASASAVGADTNLVHSATKNAFNEIMAVINPQHNTPEIRTLTAGLVNANYGLVNGDQEARNTLYADLLAKYRKDNSAQAWAAGYALDVLMRAQEIAAGKQVTKLATNEAYLDWAKENVNYAENPTAWRQAHEAPAATPGAAGVQYAQNGGRSGGIEHIDPELQLALEQLGKSTGDGVNGNHAKFLACTGTERPKASDMDGILGHRTRKAIKEVQAAHNLPETGKIDEATIAAIREDVAKQSQAAPEAAAPAAALASVIGAADAATVLKVSDEAKSYGPDALVKPGVLNKLKELGVTLTDAQVAGISVSEGVVSSQLITKIEQALHLNADGKLDEQFVEAIKTTKGREIALATVAQDAASPGATPQKVAARDSSRTAG